MSGAISIVKFDDSHIISRVFTVPKQNGGNRLVIDLSSLNKFIIKSSFRMEDKETIKTLIEPFDFMASIDLSSAFHTINLHMDSKKFVVFEFNNKRFQFNVIPFGLTSAPRIFTKLLKPVLSHLRALGIKISAYLDDIFICGHSFDLVSSQVKISIKLLEDLGFSINHRKSSLIPSQSLLHLGFIWNSVSSSLSLPESKLLKIKNLVNKIINTPQTIRNHSSLLGLLVNSSHSFRFAALHYRVFQLSFVKSLKNSYSWDDVVSLPQEAITELTWWNSCSIQMLTPLTFKIPSFDLTLYSDASKSGWGAYLSSGQTISDNWDSFESKKHINWLELKAIQLSLIYFLPIIKNKSISVKCDNQTAICYFNKLGGTHSPLLCHLALEIGKFLEENEIVSIASHISGVQNFAADYLSRHSHLHEYSLNNSAFQSMVSLLNFSLSMDLFASAMNKKLHLYCSIFKDQNAYNIDAFSFRWPSNVYIFPPIPLISRALVKIFRDDVELCLFITPDWKCLPILPRLLNSLIDLPISIKSSEIIGQLPTKRPFNLMAWPISASSSRSKEFRKMSQMPSSIAFDQAPSNCTRDIGRTLQNFLISINLPPRLLPI